MKLIKKETIFSEEKIIKRTASFLLPTLTFLVLTTFAYYALVISLIPLLILLSYLLYVYFVNVKLIKETYERYDYVVNTFDSILPYKKELFAYSYNVKNGVCENISKSYETHMNILYYWIQRHVKYHDVDYLSFSTYWFPTTNKLDAMLWNQECFKPRRDLLLKELKHHKRLFILALFIKPK